MVKSFLLFINRVKSAMIVMRKLIYSILIIAVISGMLGIAHAQSILPIPSDMSAQAQQKLIWQSGISPQVFYLAWQAYQCAREHGYGRPGILTVIDYSLPSYRKRLWVFDVEHQRLLFNTYVAHGVGSGFVKATHFSDTVDSFESSLGLYLTGQPYSGEWGYSLRLYGLEPGFNDQAYARAIVMHGCPWVSDEVAKQYGRIGVTHGCPAVPETLAQPIIDTIKTSTLLFAYYPERHWLRSSWFLHCPA